MGDRGRSRWSEGAGVVSAMYLERRFLNGAMTSENAKKKLSWKKQNKKKTNDRKYRNTSQDNAHSSWILNNSTTQLLNSL